MREALTTFLFCCALGVIIIVDTVSYPTIKGQGFGQGPAFYPKILAYSLLLMGGVGLVSSLTVNRHRTLSISENSSHQDHILHRPFLPYLVLLISVLCILLMIYTGFILGGYLLVFSSAVLIRNDRSFHTITADGLYSAGILLLIYVVFDFLIGIQLPTGTLFN